MLSFLAVFAFHYRVNERRAENMFTEQTPDKETKEKVLTVEGRIGERYTY